MPRPPAPDTAATSSGVDGPPDMGPRTTGTSTPRSSRPRLPHLARSAMLLTPPILARRALGDVTGSRLDGHVRPASTGATLTATDELLRNAAAHAASFGHS